MIKLVTEKDRGSEKTLQKLKLKLIIYSSESLILQLDFMVGKWY